MSDGVRILYADSWPSVLNLLLPPPTTRVSLLTVKNGRLLCAFAPIVYLASTCAVVRQTSRPAADTESEYSSNPVFKKFRLKKLALDFG